MDLDEDYQLQIRALVKENQSLKEQLQKVQQISSYLETKTKQYMESTEPEEKQLKFQLFKKYIADLNDPKNIFELFQRNFYYYLVQHLELEKIQRTFNELK